LLNINNLTAWFGYGILKDIRQQSVQFSTSSIRIKPHIEYLTCDNQMIYLTYVYMIYIH